MEIHWSVFDEHTQATALRSFALAARADRRKSLLSPALSRPWLLLLLLLPLLFIARFTSEGLLYTWTMLPRDRHGRPAHRSSMLKRKQLPGGDVAPPAASAQAKQVDGVQEGEAGRSAIPGRIPRKPLSSSHSKEGVMSHGSSPTSPIFPTTGSGPKRSPSPLDEVDDPDTSFASAESRLSPQNTAVRIPASSFAEQEVATGGAEAGRSRPSISTLGDEDTSALETGYSTDSVSDASEDPASNHPIVVAPASPNMSKGKGKELHLSKPSCTTLPAEILET